jgi:hypothetical protein
MISNATKAPWHLWLVGISALLFNAIGAFDYAMNMAQGATYMKGAGMTPPQVAHYQQLPPWVIVVWGVGAWGSFIGAALLLFRNRLALPILTASAVAFALYLFHMYILSDGGIIMGASLAVAGVFIAAVLSFCIWYAKRMTAQGVLT